MTTDNHGFRCTDCLCDMLPTPQYGADIRYCPRCGGLWLGHRGLVRLQTHLHEKRLDAGLAWGELGSLLADGRQPTGMGR